MLNSVKKFFSLSEDNSKNQAISHKRQEEYENLKVSNRLEENRKNINNIFINVAI